MKAATPAAAAAGGLICLCLIYGTHLYSASVTHSAVVPLFVLFVLTFGATRAGRKRKAEGGLAESHKGRTASQVVANLGVASLLAFPVGMILVAAVWTSNYDPSWVSPVLVLSALAEAAADTVSSEIGQAFGGTPFMLTTLRRVPPGTDGAITLRGTLAGIIAAAVVIATGAWAMHLALERDVVALVAAIAGLFFDSLLGATFERRGYLGNDLVNFSSTAFSAVLSFIAIWLIPGLGPHPFVMY